MVNKVRGSVIDLPTISATIPTATTYPKGTVVYNSAGSSPTGWKYVNSAWEAFSSSHIDYSTTWDPAALAAGQTATTTFTVPTAALGDFVHIGFTQNLSGLLVTGYVSSINNVTLILYNPTAGTINLPSGTLKLRLTRG